jgi:hypothetical protein
MRHGIIVKDIVVLPRLKTLHDALPLETHLFHVFKIKGRVITETENTIKQVLKNLSITELLMYGSACNKNPRYQMWSCDWVSMITDVDIMNANAWTNVRDTSWNSLLKNPQQRRNTDALGIIRSITYQEIAQIW